MKNLSVFSVTSVVNDKDTELSPLPTECQVVRLGEVASIQDAAARVDDRAKESMGYA